MDNIVKYKNVELIELTKELNELLAEKSPIIVKYKLGELFTKASKACNAFVEVRNQLIKELGNEEGFVAVTVPDPEDPSKEITNPKYLELLEKLKPIDEDEKEFKFRKLSSSFIENIETTSNFPLLYRLFDFGNEDVQSE
jgi:hypothetical protein